MKSAFAGLLLFATGVFAQTSTLDLMRSTTFVFAGTVTRGAIGGGVAMVRIDDIYFGRQTVGGAKGETVRLAVTTPATQGDSQLWFSDVTAWRDLLDLREIGRQPLANRETAQRAIDAAASEVADERLIDHLRTAAVIVEGNVAGVRAFGSGPHFSEHDPIWTLVDIDVTRVLRGDAARRITALFPASIDVMWYAGPKFKAGDRGTFVLHSTAPRAPRDVSGFFFIVTNQDFFGPQQQERIRRLVSRLTAEVTP